MPARKWIALLCIAVVLLAAIAQSSAGGQWIGILATLCFLFAIVVLAPIRAGAEPEQLPSSPFLSILLGRAPPLR